MTEERFSLVTERIAQMKEDVSTKEPYGLYFKQVAFFLLKVKECYEYIKRQGIFGADPGRLAQYQEELYKDIATENYGTSFANPVFAVGQFGKEHGGLLSFLYSELLNMVSCCYEQDLEALTIRMECFVEIYNVFEYAEKEEGKEASQVAPEELRQIIYWFVHDYLEDEMAKRIRKKVDPGQDFAYRLIMESDLSEPSYLYRFGEYISANEIKTAQYLAGVDEKQIQLMADTYTEGYRIGFEKTGKDLTKKEVVQIVYPLGFERMIRKAIRNFEKMGLKPAIMRTPHSIFDRRGMAVGGFYSTCINKQFLFDHKEDEALFLDKKIVNRKLEVNREGYEEVKKLARVHAGPAWVEVFGEKPFVPESKIEALKLSDKQQKLQTEFLVKNGQLINEYIPGEERSFTIIAFPIPEIGDEYEEIMKETIALNTLDYVTYETIQQCMIDALDEAEYVVVEGKGENRTHMKVQLATLTNPAKETKFENCVADVNIPVGEVFTSPVLEKTEGILHVTSVFLNELEYKNLWMSFENGMVTDYGCDNFENTEENRKYIKDNILYHHDSLSIGEFAIGTNTTAYRMGKKYGIAGLLPILIAEKTGPHFAVGDTCYSHAEDVAVYNTDGKEIIARDNSISILRKTDQEKAYFQCHTDITIPYDELDAIYGVGPDGSEIPIIQNGRFVLSGCEKLNEALD